MVQLLKQFHACFYWLYEKCMTCAMVGLQGLHLGDTLRHPNISTGMGLKLFCPWCFKLGRNIETITIHLWEVHYRMVTVCDICQVFAGMTTQSILDHHSGYKVKHDKKHTECEGHEKVPKVPQEKQVQVMRTKGSI